MGSGFKTWLNGDVLTDSDLNGYLMRQAVVTCPSGTRPSSPTTGQPIYETDTKLIRVWDGSAWYCPASPDYTSTVPTFYSNLSSATAIAGGNVSVSYAKHQVVNKRCHYFGHATINQTTSGGFGLSLPVVSAYRSFSLHGIYLTGSGGDSSYANAIGIGFIPGISAPYNRFGPGNRANVQLNGATAGDAVTWNILSETA